MIVKSGITRYLNRDLDDHRWMKELTKKEVDELIASLRPRPKLHPKLALHQKIAFYLGVTYPQFSFWLDMGTGKTLVSLELIKYWYRFGFFKKALVLVLSDKSFSTWERQAEQFNVGLPVVALEGTSKEKWNTLNNFDHGIVLSTYPGTLAMCCVKGMKKRGQRKVPGLLLNHNLVDDLCEDVGVFIADESTKLGHSTSLLHKMGARIADNVDCRYALAGRPFGRDPTLLYNQQLIIDKGESFGLIEMFQLAFFSRDKNQWSKNRYAYTYNFLKRTTPELTRLMQHRSISYDASECVDLPKVVRIQERIRFNKDMQDMYVEATKGLARSQGNFTEVKNIFLRMRQITSGFLGFKNDENGERAQIAFAANPKLERVLDLIEELPEGRKALIPYEFTWSAKQLTKELSKSKRKHIWLWSGTKNSRKELDKFQNDPECRFAVIQNKVGAYSLDGLQKVANYMFVYESPLSIIDREQLERRIERQGQKRTVFIYDLIVPNSVDSRILEFHQEGKDIMDAIKKDPKVLV